MRTVRRAGALAVACLFAGALISTPANAADRTEVFSGTAKGQALHLKLLGQEATFGQASSLVSGVTNMTAVAKGAGQLLNVPTQSEATLAKPDGGKQCGPAILPAAVSAIATLNTVCSSSKVVTGDLPSAVAEGSVASLELNANTVLGALPNLADTLEPALAPLSGTPLGSVTQVVTDVVNSVQNTKTLDVTLGKSTTDVTSTAGKLSTVATASGGEVRILPTPTITGVTAIEPLVTITVGSSSATAVYDRVAGKVAEPTFDAALVTVKTAAIPALNLGSQTIKVAPGTDLTLLAGTPLESTIVVASGRKISNPDGSVGAVADGVSLHLLKGLNGGVLLELAHAEALVGGAPAVITPAPAINNPVTPAELPRTGNTPWIPVAGAGLLGIALLSRRIAIRTR